MTAARLERAGILPLAVMTALFALLAYGGITVSRLGSSIPSFWLPNVVLAAWILHDRKIRPDVYLVCSTLTNIAVNRALGNAWLPAIGLSLSNAAEVIFVVLAMRQLCGPKPSMANFRDYVCLLIVVPNGAILSSLAAGLVLPDADGAISLSIVKHWFLSDSLSMLIFLPVSLIMIDMWRNRGQLVRGDWNSWIFSTLLTILATFIVFSQNRYPVLFLVPLIVLISAFKNGIFGTTISLLLITVTAIVSTADGHVPVFMAHLSADERGWVLQLFLAANFAIGLPVAALLDERARDRGEIVENRRYINELVTNVKDVIFRTDAAGRWRFLNPAWEEATGYSVEESIGRRIEELISPEDLPTIVEIHRGLASGAIFERNLVIRFLNRRGEVRTAEASVRRLEDENGTYAGSIGSIRDITESHRQAKALTQSEERFRILAQSAPVGIFRTDQRGRFTFINDAGTVMTGMSDADVMQHGWVRLLHPADRPRVVRNWLKAIRSRSEFRDEFRLRANDGAAIWLDVVGRPETDEPDKPCGFIGVILNVSAYKNALAELEERDQLLTRIMDNVTDTVIRLGPDGKCLYASPSAVEVFGVSPDQLVGNYILMNFHRDDDANVRQTLGDLMAGTCDRALFSFRAAPVNAPGRYQWLEANCASVVDPQTGQVSEVIASIRNISHAKALEDDLRAEVQRAEAAAQAKSAFLANMSHEIRTPMNGVIGFTELALAGDLTDEQRSNLEVIAESGRTMLSMLNDLLDFAKIESGGMTVAAEPLDLVHKVKTAIRLLETNARKKGLKINFSAAGDVPARIVSDRMRVQQILVNLIGNAIKFTDRGSIDVSVAVAGKADERELRVAIADTGIGITQEQIGKIFDEFVQADNSIARRFGGTGLGLPISSRLAGLLGGRIEVASQPGKGSTFTLVLPLIVADQAPESPQADRDVRIEFSKRGRVLVAEDNAINQRLTTAMLTRLGLTVDLAEDGQQAVDKVDTAARSGALYDLVLMDMQMPVMDGYEATRRIRAMGLGAQDLPIVALTANAYPEDIVASREAGMQDHLAKPLHLAELAATLGKWIRGAPAPQSNAPIADVTPKLMEMFVERKRETVAAIDQVLTNAGGDPEQLQQLAGQFHQLAGVAALFGEPQLGEASSEAERRLRADESGAAQKLLEDMRKLLTA